MKTFNEFNQLNEVESIATIQKTKITIEFPCFVGANDYHQFPEYGDIMKMMGIKGVKVIEVSEDSFGDYDVESEKKCNV